MSSVKIELPNSTIRRVPCGTQTLAGLIEVARNLVTLQENQQVQLTYKDSDGDIVTLGSDTEVIEIFRTAAQTFTVPKFTVVLVLKEVSDDKQQQKQQEPSKPEEPVKPKETPLGVVARALADPAVVASIQRTLASPIVSDAVTDVAKAFLDNPEHSEISAVRAAIEQVPLLQTLWLDLVREQPVIDEAVSNFLDSGLMPSMFGCSRSQNNVHFHVVCDGCSDNTDLKAAAVLAQTISDKGYIAGARYKSVTVHDFDLCETCHSTDRFQAQAPFAKMLPQHFGGGRGGFFRGFSSADSDRHWRSRGHCHPHHHQPHHGGPGGPFGGHGGPGGPFGGHGGPFGGGRRGCRGSGANKFSEAFRDIIAQGASAFAEASDGEMADIARAVAMSLGGNPKPATATSEQPQQAQEMPKATVASEATTPKEPELAFHQQVPLAQPANEQPVADDWERADSDFVKWAKELDQLQAIGFVELEKYVQFLEEEDGDLERVINRIVRRNA